MGVSSYREEASSDVASYLNRDFQSSGQLRFRLLDWPKLFMASDVWLGTSFALFARALGSPDQTGLSLYVEAFIPEGCHRVLDMVSGVEGLTKDEECWGEGGLAHFVNKGFESCSNEDVDGNTKLDLELETEGSMDEMIPICRELDQASQDIKDTVRWLPSLLPQNKLVHEKELAAFRLRKHLPPLHMHSAIEGDVPFLILDEEKRLKLLPLMFLHEEAPRPGNSTSWTEVPCASAASEISLEKWVHVGCEVSNDFMRLHIDGVVVGEKPLSSSLKNGSNPEDLNRVTLSGTDGGDGKLQGYVHNVLVLPLKSSIKDHSVKNPPLQLSIDSSCASEIEEGSDGVWSIVGGKIPFLGPFELMAEEYTKCVTNDMIDKLKKKHIERFDRLEVMLARMECWLNKIFGKENYSFKIPTVKVFPSSMEKKKDEVMLVDKEVVLEKKIKENVSTPILSPQTVKKLQVKPVFEMRSLPTLKIEVPLKKVSKSPPRRSLSPQGLAKVRDKLTEALSFNKTQITKKPKKKKRIQMKRKSKTHNSPGSSFSNSGRIMQEHSPKRMESKPKIVGLNHASCRRNFSLDVVLLDALGQPVNKEIEVFASLLYADNGMPVEKPKDAEAPLLTSYDGIEFASFDRPSKLLHGRAAFKLKISQLSSKCDNRLFRIRFDSQKMGRYPFLEAYSRPIRCISRNRNSRTSSMLWKKTTAFHPLDGPQSLRVDDGSPETHHNNGNGHFPVSNVCESIPSPPPKRVKVRQDKFSVMVQADPAFERSHDECDSHALNANQGENLFGTSLEGKHENLEGTDNTPSDSESVEARNSALKKVTSIAIADQRTPHLLRTTASQQAIPTKPHRQRLSSLTPLPFISMMKMSMNATCSTASTSASSSTTCQSLYQILIAKRLVEEGINCWNLISQHHHPVLWENAVFEIEEQFMKISQCTTRGLSEQDFELLRRIAGCRDYLARENFDRMWYWLYPIAFTLSRDWINAMWGCTSPMSIEGLITKEEAESSLRSSRGLQEPGTFILRFPTSRSWPHPDAGSLIVTYVGTDYNLHHRLLSLDYRYAIFFLSLFFFQLHTILVLVRDDRLKYSCMPLPYM
ncbi:hypothetical protein HHK36_023427 [Tetracentron sinense]|uniref:SH2 domain-containing protein n=1 Tax=Tetracentron sinense TaxID=13715 RepID=A0A835D5U9_TETSI|nr:hypothetical protein HHK36_023427 [Tetracentron sinense]